MYTIILRMYFYTFRIRLQQTSTYRNKGRLYFIRFKVNKTNVYRE